MLIHLFLHFIITIVLVITVFTAQLFYRFIITIIVSFNPFSNLSLWGGKRRDGKHEGRNINSRISRISFLS